MKRYEPSIHYKKLAKDIIEITQRTVYFVHNGRNAWHNSWSQHHFHACLHGSLVAAKEFCEKMRVQGSRFYILEVPALVIQTEDLAAHVLEINSPAPLQNYNPVCTDVPKIARPKHYFECIVINGKELIISEGKKLSWHESNVQPLKVGNLLNLALSTFSPDSYFWKPRRLFSKSVLIGVSKKVDVDQNTIHQGPYKKWGSRSYGPNYNLTWEETTYECSNIGILSILDQINQLEAQQSQVLSCPASDFIATPSN